MEWSFGGQKVQTQAEAKASVTESDEDDGPVKCDSGEKPSVAQPV
jgi:hypothetical protein